MVNAFFHPYIGGTEKHMYELGRRLAKQEDLYVLTSRLKNTKEYEELENMKIFRVKAKEYKMPLIYPPPLVIAHSARKKIEKLDKEIDFDVFNLHGRWFPDFGHVVKYANRKGKLVTLTLHNGRPVGISPLVTVLGTSFDIAYGKKLLKKVDRIIAVSADLKEDIAKYGLDREKIVVIHNGVDTDFYKPSEPTFRNKYDNDFENLLLFVGRIVKQKGLHLLIDAMPEILREHPRTGLLIVGKGKMRQYLERKIKRMGLEKNIVFPGFIDDSLMPQLYSSADIFVLPSLWETFGFVLVEAASCGVPLCASNAGGIPEVVKEGENGCIFEMGNVKDTAEKLNTMLDDGKLRRDMGRKGRETALKKFDWDLITAKTSDFYGELIDEPRRNR
jgi:glycosyltransferase involved in cell wall biosynthesis